MITLDPSWKCTQGCIAHHAVMLDLECAGMKGHPTSCSCADIPAVATELNNHLFRATILTHAGLGYCRTLELEFRIYH